MRSAYRELAAFDRDLQQHVRLEHELLLPRAPELEHAPRLVELTRRITELTGGRVEARFARLFLKLADQMGRPDRGGVFIPMPLSRQALADLTGTTIETCIRIMIRAAGQG